MPRSFQCQGDGAMTDLAKLSTRAPEWACRYAPLLLGLAAIAFVVLSVSGPTRLFAADIPSLRAKVTALRFFEDAHRPGAPATRRYTEVFPVGRTRYVYWELSLQHPAPGARRPFVLREVWSRNGIVVYREEHRFVLEADWTYSQWFAGANFGVQQTSGAANPFHDLSVGRSGSEMFRCRDFMGEWGPCPGEAQTTRRVLRPGRYDLALFVDGQLAAKGKVHLVD